MANLLELRKVRLENDDGDKAFYPQTSTDMVLNNKGENLETLLNKKGNVEAIQEINFRVEETAWIEDFTFENFGFKAKLPISKVTENYICTSLTLDHTNENLNGMISEWVNTGNGYVEFFANKRPATFTIEVIRFEKVVN